MYMKQGITRNYCENGVKNNKANQSQFPLAPSNAVGLKGDLKKQSQFLKG